MLQHLFSYFRPADDTFIYRVLTTGHTSDSIYQILRTGILTKKGSSLSLSVARMGKTAADLERAAKEGRAEDAAAVMQLLTGEPDYAEVASPQAIVKVANSGLEQFTLDLTLAGGELP